MDDGIGQTAHFGQAAERARYAFNVLHGYPGDAKIYTFDYHEMAGVHVRETTFHLGPSPELKIIEPGSTDFTVAAIEFARELPGLVIYPETSWDNLVKYSGGIDIDMESIQFTDAYRIWSRDKRFAYDICHGRVMEFLYERPSLALKIERNVVALRFPELVDLDDLTDCLNTLNVLIELVPNFVFPK